MPSRRPLVLASGIPRQIPANDSMECESVLLKGSVDAFFRSNAGTIEARNAANSSHAPLSGSALSAISSGGNILMFAADAGGGNAGMEFRTAGVIYQDWTADFVSDYHARFILVSSTQFRFQAAGALNYYFDAPLNAQSLALDNPLPVSSGGTGAITPLAARSGLGVFASASSAKTAAYTITTADSGKVIECNAASAAFTVTLPSATAASQMTFTVRKTDSTRNPITIACNGSDLILGSGSYLLSNSGESISFVSTGSASWAVLGSTNHLLVMQPEGLTTLRNTENPNTQLTIAPGRAVIQGRNGGLNATLTGERWLAVLPFVTTKRLDAVWAAGSGNGGRFSGSSAVAANQWWHVLLMRNTSTGAVDVGFDTATDAINCPSGWAVRMIGSFRTDGSSNIMSYYQIDNTFYWTTEQLDLSSAIGTTASLATLSVPPIENVEAIVRIASGLPATGAASAVLVSSPKSADLAPAIWGPASAEARYVMGSTAAHQSVVDRVQATSSQVRVRAGFTLFGGTATWQTNPKIHTIGYVHPRGAY